MHKARISASNYFPTLSDAYAAAQTGNTIEAWGTLFTENLSCDQPIGITLKGGYNSDYTVKNGYTSLKGVLKIGKGSLIVERLEIR